MRLLLGWRKRLDAIEAIYGFASLLLQFQQANSASGGARDKAILGRLGPTVFRRNETGSKRSVTVALATA